MLRAKKCRWIMPAFQVMATDWVDLDVVWLPLESGPDMGVQRGCGVTEDLKVDAAERRISPSADSLYGFADSLHICEEEQPVSPG